MNYELATKLVQLQHLIRNETHSRITSCQLHLRITVNVNKLSLKLDCGVPDELHHSE